MSPTTIPDKSSDRNASRSCSETSTCENGDYRLVDSLYLFLLEHVTREERGNEQHDHDEQRP